MTAEMDDYRYVLVYEIGREQHIETFYTKQEMERFIERDDVHPLFQYEEKSGVRTMKIQDLLKQVKPCWKYATYDINGWRLFDDKPRFDEKMNEWIMSMLGHSFHLKDLFYIEPFDGDWKDSLICRDECGL